MEQNGRNFYEIVGVSPDADQRQIEEACLRFGERYRPDRNPGNSDAVRMFALFENALAILSDPAKRAAYDAQIGVKATLRTSAVTSKGADEKFCLECGAVIRAKAEICPQCGVRQMPLPGSSSVNSRNEKNKLVAALFAILLGGFGIHKFYLGKVGQGVLYLLFCWTFIPFLIGFVEGLVYLVMKQEDFDRKYGSV